MVKYSLVGYDGSDASRRAFQFAIDLARCSQGPGSRGVGAAGHRRRRRCLALMMADSGTAARAGTAGRT